MTDHPCDDPTCCFDDHDTNPGWSVPDALPL
jgi:hypothetical protein